MIRKGRGLLGAAGIGLNQAPPDTKGQKPTTEKSDALDKMDATDLMGPLSKVRTRNESKPILSGEVKMQTVYVTREDQDRATDAVAHLKKMRVVRGQIGFSLAVRIGLRLLEQQLRNDEEAVVSIARELSRFS
jgi:hypothetical protein